jgi:3-oxoacyl-[acyl-carrier-protein] synthase II
MSVEVIISGLGVVSPIGIGLDAVWNALVTKQSGVRTLTAFDVSKLPIRFGGEVADFDPKLYVKPRKSLKVMSRDIQLAFAAADQAWADGGFASGAFDPERLGVVFGSDLIHPDPEEMHAAYRQCLDEASEFDGTRWGDAALREIYPLWMLKHLPNMPACHIGIAIDARGPNNTITLGEVSSAAAVAEALQTIRRGRADVMLTGGTGSRITPTAMLRSTTGPSSRDNTEPQRASRPFDAGRNGEVNGEGAAAFVLESADSARRRGAKPQAKCLGVGSGFGRTSAGGATSETIAAAIRRTLDDAGLAAADVGFVVAAGRSTMQDDAAEAAAIRAVLGDVPVTAPSSFYGNLGSAAGAVALAVAVAGLKHRTVPPTLNYEVPDPQCAIHVAVDSEPLEKCVAIVLSHTPMGQSAALAVAAGE